MKKILVFLGCLVLTACSRKDETNTVEVPQQYCTRQYTGNTKSDTIYVQTCYAYNDQGICTMNIPTPIEYNYKEVLVQCAWTEWHSQ